MGNQEYGPPPSKEPIGYGPPPSGNPVGFGAPPPVAGPPVASPPVMPPAPMPLTQYPQAYPSAYPPASPQAYPSAYPSAFPPPLGGARSDRNWMGITSLVLGLVGGGLLGLAFGIGGIRAAKEGRANNRTLAIWGVVTNIVSPIVLLGFALSVGNFGTAFNNNSVSYDNLAIGDCVKEPGGYGDAGGELDSVYLSVIPCEEEHWGQVYFSAPIEASTYPGDAEVDAQSVAICESDGAYDKVDSRFWPKMYYTSIVPTRSAWQHNHTVLCVLTSSDGPLSRSWVVEP